jgi:hypothetical protein
MSFKELKLSANLFEFNLIDINSFIEEKKNEINIDDKMKTGFNKFLICLDLYLDLLEITTLNNGKIKVYGTVTLDNGEIIHATNSYHGRSLFSNISIIMNNNELFEYSSDKGICYGQIISLSLFNFIIIFNY